MKKKSLLGFRLWSILYPLLLYWATVVIVMFIARRIFGETDSSYMLCQIMASLVAFPVVYFSFYRPDHPKGQKVDNLRGKLRAYHVLFIIAIAALCGIALNNILIMSPLADWSTGYKEVSARFYGSTLLIECIGTGILAPILEELLYRGVIFGRLRYMMPDKVAAVVSAFIFAFMHFNLVQFIYAFVLGLLLAYFMIRTQNFWGAMLAHITINLISVLRTETGILQQTVDGTLSAWLVTLAIALMGVGLLVLYVTKRIDTEEKDYEIRND